jgi:cardiolipin synthase
VQVLQSNVRKQRKSIQKALAGQIRIAEKDVRVASSYFMPPGFLKRVLLSKSSTKDINTSILVSGTTDFYPVPGDLWAQTHALSRFIHRPNTRVSLYSRSHMHAKFTTVDSLFVSLGSYNFDRFSSRRNLESAIGVFDRNVAIQVAEIHKLIFAQSSIATGNSYFENPFARFICWLAYVVMKTSGRNVFDGFDVLGSGEGRNRLVNISRPESIATSLKFF